MQIVSENINASFTYFLINQQCIVFFLTGGGGIKAFQLHHFLYPQTNFFSVGSGVYKNISIPPLVKKYNALLID